MVLYRVGGAQNRIALGDLADGVEFFTAAPVTAADGSQDGSILLTPVRVVTASTKRGTDDASGAVHDPYNTLPQE